MARASEDILVIQSGSSEIQTYQGLGDDQVLELMEKASSPLAERLRVTMNRLQAVEEEVIKDPDKVVRYFALQSGQAHADEVVNRELEQVAAEDHAGRIDEYHRYASVGSCLLYANTNFGGSTKFVTVTWPNLSWWPYRFNDRASSARAWGGNILFQHSWYRGRRMYLIGLPYFQAPDLSRFGFNDIASSYVGF